MNTPALNHFSRRDYRLPAWDEMQLGYWDSVAVSYDELYQDAWSKLENLAVVARLRRILPPNTAAILDLGCGTGLGASLLRQALSGPIQYHGLDLSPSMLDICQRRVPNARLESGTMTDLSSFDPSSFDAVTAFFGAASYAASAGKTIACATRVLRPGGVLYLSFFGRSALRRLVKARLHGLERYRTRHEKQALPPLIHVYTGSCLTQACLQTPELESCVIEGQGALAGVLQAPRLWSLSTAIDRKFPALSHQLEVIVRRRADQSPR